LCITYTTDYLLFCYFFSFKKMLNVRFTVIYVFFLVVDFCQWINGIKRAAVCFFNTFVSVVPYSKKALGFKYF
jgi:hypothetical protein